MKYLHRKRKDFLKFGFNCRNSLVHDAGSGFNHTFAGKPSVLHKMHGLQTAWHEIHQTAGYILGPVISPCTYTLWADG